MTPERAQEIVTAINQRCFFTMGIGEAELSSLKGVTLSEMLHAKLLLERQNASAEHVDGQKTIRVVPDDRLIAAAYCMEHYPVSDGEAILAVPATKNERFWHEKELKALVIVPADRGDGDAA